MPIASDRIDDQGHCKQIRRICTRRQNGYLITFLLHVTLTCNQCASVPFVRVYTDMRVVADVEGSVLCAAAEAGNLNHFRMIISKYI